MNHQLEHISAFVRVAELGSYTRAAEALGSSRTRLSRQVMALEETLGVRLLQRTTRRLHLTHEGERYLAHAQSILRALDEAASDVSSAAQTVRGEMRINAPMSFGVRHLAPLVADFMVEHPALDVRLDLNDRRVDLIEEGYDLAIRIGQLTDSSLIARRITRCRMLFCASPGYLERYGTPLDSAALAEHRGLRYKSGQASAEWRLGDGTTLTPHGPLESNNGDVLTQMAEAGLGIAQQPSFLVTESILAGRLVALFTDQPPTLLDIYALYPARRYLPAKVERFIATLHKAWGEPPCWERAMGLSQPAQQ
ncbi:LysR substrate-binding domain-containing protein [Halomonas sp. HNIBRBA4712]|uniref:LysR family transcriptional regulator n=1 Tax=Halomonas sp. HNIBRBA4712 TaxID=3373087 RepID=UPI0037475246